MCLKNKSLVSVVLSIALFSSLVPAVRAQEMKQKAPIIVNGDKVEYFHEQKKVVGTGNISIDYEDVRLTCDKVTVYLDTREALAEGNVKITQKDAYFTGEKLNYNFDKRTGKAIDAYVNYVPFYGRS
ncbi:MAG: LPS export ABC transporter periplasmic protein LptC, partial [Candidatus Omnitrophota bacterium]